MAAKKTILDVACSPLVSLPGHYQYNENKEYV